MQEIPRKFKNPIYITLLAGGLLLLGLYLTSLYSYLLFHSLAEIFSIVIAFSIFVLAWNCRNFIDNNYLIFLGIAYLFIGFIDLIHTLAYAGMGVFTGYGANLPTQLWIAARYLQSISLLVACFILDKKKIKINLFLLVYTILLSLLFLSIFYWKIFPACFIDDSGLTPFKKMSEYIISLILFASLFFLFRKKEKFDRQVLQWLIISILLTIVSELAFTFYVSVYGLSNLVGHIFKILSFYFIYRAILVTGLTQPQELLYRNLQESENRFKELFNHISSGVAIYEAKDNGQDFIIKDFNQAAERIDKVKKEDIVGKSALKVLPGLKDCGIFKVLKEVYQTGKPRHFSISQYQDQRVSGWRENYIYKLPSGEIVALYDDITDRKQIEEEIKWLASFPTLNPTPVIEIDKKKGITFINTSAKRLFPDLKDKQIDHPFVAGAIKYFTELNSSMVTHDDREIEVNGHWYLQTFFLVSPNQLRIYASDISKRKQMESELIHSEKMAIAGQLAAGVAHEFNNLLSIIGGSAEYAKGIRTKDEVKKSLEVIVKSTKRGAQVVKKLLTFTKRIELKKESADLIEVMEGVIELADRDLENNSITVVRNYADIPRTLMDIGQIQQVFLNLIINAKNAMSKGGKIVIKVEWEGEFIKIQLHNTGRTINKEDLPKLFTPFFVTSSQQKNGIPGTGLGLAVSYGIIKAHHGTITAESMKGKGTTFTVFLPVTKNENRAEVLPKAVAKASKNNKRKLKQAEILIVDDEVEIGKLLKQVLDEEGYSVTVADSGRSALNLCRKKNFDLIYLDMIMPGMDGISAFKKIKEISPKTKIVFFTGKLIEDKVAAMCLEEGAAGFLRKPISLKDLISYTQNILE